jgi:predicted phosphodiesterase
MKIAVLSDIHGNLPALQAVAHDIDRWRPDLTVVAGDVVNGGPQNLACWQFVRERQVRDGWHILRGNHEEYVVEWLGAEKPPTTAEFELRRLSYHTYHQLMAHVPDLAALFERFDWRAPDGTTLLVLHASLLGRRAGLYPWTPTADMRARTAPWPGVFVTAHTHMPFQRRLDETQILNVGAVGLPGDGDSRAGYGRVTWSAKQGWQTALRRVPYDRAAAEAATFAGDFLITAGPGALMTLVELRSARDTKTRWAQQYQPAIRAGEISVAESVRQFLANPEFAPYLTEFRRAGEFVPPRWTTLT